MEVGQEGIWWVFLQLPKKIVSARKRFGLNS
jgi:hypothetical protein